MLAHEISAPQIEAWLNAGTESLRTRRNYQNDVRNLFNFAVRRGYVASNPLIASKRSSWTRSRLKSSP